MGYIALGQFRVGNSGGGGIVGGFIPHGESSCCLVVDDSASANHISINLGMLLGRRRGGIQLSSRRNLWFF